jgi:coproporphyrinogen III oxidase-like Fe-S oxidoreductase
MGWAATPQEVFDNTLINFRVGEDPRIMLPQFVCQDGYFLSHIPDKVILPDMSQVKEFFFDDDTFNIRKSRVLELCAKLKPLNFTWSCTSRVTVDHETLKAMKEAGCSRIFFGIESGNNELLQTLSRNNYC